MTLHRHPYRPSLYCLPQAHCSMPYRAPELFDVPSPGRLDWRAADVWALGGTLHAAMYGGMPPFQAAVDSGSSQLLAALK